MSKQRSKFESTQVIVTNLIVHRNGRFGLFMAYPPLAIGENSMYQQKKPRCNPEGENPKEVLSDPKNITTNPVKRGPGIDKVLFLAPSYNAVGELYKPPIFKLTRREHRDLQIASGNEKPFRD